MNTSSSGDTQRTDQRTDQRITRRVTERLNDRVNALGPVREARAEVARLSRRVGELEGEIAECRRQHQRVAELTDIVQALLVPIARRDDAALEQLLREYADRLG